MVAFRDGRWMRLAPEPPLARAVTAVHAWATPSATPPREINWRTLLLQGIDTRMRGAALAQQGKDSGGLCASGLLVKRRRVHQKTCRFRGQFPLHL